MADLVNRIQQCILGSTQDDEKLRQLLIELRIEGGRQPTPNCLEEVRRVVLRSGASESEMREAFSNIGLSGVGPNDELRARLIKLLSEDPGEVPTA